MRLCVRTIFFARGKLLQRGKSDRNVASQAARADRFRTRVEYFPAASEMKVKSGLIDEAFVSQTFHLEN